MQNSSPKAAFDLHENLVSGLAELAVEQAANDFLAAHANPGAPRPKVTGKIAEAVARLAFTEMAALSSPMSDSMLIAALPGADDQTREQLIKQMELK